MNPDSIRIAIFGVRSADAINPDSIRIEVLVRTHLKCSWWQLRQTNDGVAFEQSIFAKIMIIKVFCVAVNMYVPIFRGLDARGGRKLQTDRQRHTHTHTRQLQYPSLNASTSM